MIAKRNALTLPVSIIGLFLAVMAASPAVAALTDPALTIRSQTAENPTDADREKQLIASINKIRTDAHLPALIARPDLSEAARRHSKTMADTNMLVHVDANGHTASDRIRDAGYPAFIQIGENIAMNGGYSDPVDKAVTDWMTSNGHRINIMNPVFTETGVGIVEKGDVYFFTQVFARPRQSTAGADGRGATDKAIPTTPTTPMTSELNRTRLLELINAQRLAHGLAVVKLSENLSEAAQAGSDAVVLAMAANATSLSATPLDRRLHDARYVATGPVFENVTIGLDDADHVIALWQSNGGTVYANMLRPELVEIGIGHTGDKSAVISRNAWDILFAATP